MRSANFIPLAACSAVVKFHNKSNIQTQFLYRLLPYRVRLSIHTKFITCWESLTKFGRKNKVLYTKNLFFATLYYHCYPQILKLCCPRTMLWLIVNLSKLISPPTDDVSVHFCVVYLVVSEMAAVQERARCVARLFETKSVIRTLRNHQIHLNKPPASEAPFRYWQWRFLERGNFYDHPRSVRPIAGDDVVE